MRRPNVPLLVLLLFALTATPARAGGWWSSIGFEGQPLGVGESISLRVSEIMFDSLEEAERARGETFHAYLVREFDEAALDEAMTRANPGDWWTPLTRPIPAGTVELFGWDANLASARVRLDVPRVAPGPYSLMLCDDGCDVALGNLIPSGVDVTTAALAARTSRRLRESEADLTLALRRARSDLRRIRAAVRQAGSGDAEQTKRIEILEDRLAAGKRSDPPWITYAGWFSAGAAGALLLAGRRGRRRTEIEVLAERIPDDARELAGTQ